VPAEVDVGRLGGDEFLALTRVHNLDTIEEFARQVIVAIERVASTTGQTLSASIGVARGADREAPDRLLRRADQAMYAAKKRGRGLIVVDAGGTLRQAERA
jgi:diguanylate cyclase (GGDEF)-like protein